MPTSSPVFRKPDVPAAENVAAECSEERDDCITDDLASVLGPADFASPMLEDESAEGGSNDAEAGDAEGTDQDEPHIGADIEPRTRQAYLKKGEDLIRSLL